MRFLLRLVTGATLLASLIVMVTAAMGDDPLPTSQLRVPMALAPRSQTSPMTPSVSVDALLPDTIPSLERERAALLMRLELLLQLEQLDRTLDQALDAIVLLPDNLDSTSQAVRENRNRMRLRRSRAEQRDQVLDRLGRLELRRIEMIAAAAEQAVLADQTPRTAPEVGAPAIVVEADIAAPVTSEPEAAAAAVAEPMSPPEIVPPVTSLPPSVVILESPHSETGLITAVLPLPPPRPVSAARTVVPPRPAHDVPSPARGTRRGDKPSVISPVTARQTEGASPARCRSIVQRAQLGEELTNVQRNFLRQGCPALP